VRYLILSIIALSILSGLAYTIRKGGADSAKAECLKAQERVLKDDTRRLSNRPKSNDDVINRLRQWGDRSRKAEDKSI